MRPRAPRTIAREASEIRFLIQRLRRAIFPTTMELLYEEAIRDAYTSPWTLPVYLPHRKAA